VLMMKRSLRSRYGGMGAMAAALLFAATMTMTMPEPARAQETGDAADPAAALADTLVAACRANEADFASHLTSANAAAFRALPATQRSELMKRLSLSDVPGKPLLSADNDNMLCCAAGLPIALWNTGSARRARRKIWRSFRWRW
jgi:hypothetical protein